MNQQQPELEEVFVSREEVYLFYFFLFRVISSHFYLY